MGTTYTIKIIESTNNYNLIQSEIDSILDQINQLFSTYILNSEISLFNKSNNKFKISDKFNDLYLKSSEIYKI